MEWFYERDGRQAGPVSRTEIMRLILRHQIGPDTLVWTESFGDSWRRAAEAGFVSSLTGPLRPTGTLVNRWAWIMLVAPNCLNLIFLLASQLVFNLPIPPVLWLILVSVLLVIGSSLVAFSFDRSALRAAGMNPPSFWWWLFPPGYFAARLRLTGQGRGLFVASIAVLIINLVIHNHFAPEVHQELKQLQHVWAADTTGDSGSPSSDERDEI